VDRSITPDGRSTGTASRRRDSRSPDRARSCRGHLLPGLDELGLARPQIVRAFASNAVGRKLGELMADADQPGDFGVQIADPLADQRLGMPAGAGTPVAHHEQVGDLTKPEPKLLSAADETQPV
jgi:hypothetical protein